MVSAFGVSRDWHECGVRSFRISALRKRMALRRLATAAISYRCVESDGGASTGRKDGLPTALCGISYPARPKSEGCLVPSTWCALNQTAHWGEFSPVSKRGSHVAQM